MTDDHTCLSCGRPVDPGSGRCANCGTVPANPPPRIKGYEILGRVGEGGMGAVFLARDEVLNRRVAIKVVSRRVAGDPQAQERFLREARVLATVEHPNVVRVYSFGKLEGDGAYLVLEYVEGETLSDRIAGQGPLAIDDALTIMRQVVLALDAAYEHGIVHRDIKPSNILIGKREIVRVADFGLARPTKLDAVEAITQTGYMLGTPHYVSPEQALGKPVDFRSDIYSLGIVLYEMLTGARPFEGTTPMAVLAKSMNEPLPDIRTKRSDVSKKVVDLVEWMTSKDASRRPESYARLLAAIESDERQTPVRHQRISQPRLRTFVAGAAIGLILGVLAFVLRPEPVPVSTTRPPASRMTIAVSPFWGPDDVSTREGRVMAALVERSIQERLGADVTVLGIDRTGEPVRTHDGARAVAKQLGAGIIVWGEAIALRDDTEIFPSFTLLGSETQGSKPALDLSGPRDSTAVPTFLKRGLDDESMERATVPLRLSAEAPDQIELRRTSANDIGDMVSFLAGLQSLRAGDAEKALNLFEQSQPTVDVLRHQAEALVRLDRVDEAVTLLERAIALDPGEAAAHARLADLLWTRRDEAAAIEHYRIAASTATRPPTLHAALHDERLFAREIWEKSEGKYEETGYLIIVDPESRRVLERHFMPGQILSFQSSPEGLTLTWSLQSPKSLEARQTLLWHQGAFDKPLHPSGYLVRRMTAIRSGLFPGFNFIQGAWGPLQDQDPHPRYAPPEDPDDVDEHWPKTYEELEAFLLPAVERDPTQPWHLFNLGWVRRMTDREEEAIETWSILMERDWPGVPYSEFVWMARLFERLGEQRWADRAFDRALTVRGRMLQKVTWSTALEKLVVGAPVARLHEANLDDPERAYQWLQRSRALAGETEGDRMVAGVWSEWFERQNDVTRAAAEAEYQKTVFDPVSRAARLDYLSYSLATLVLSFLVLVPFVCRNGVRRAKLSSDEALETSPMPTGLLIGAAVFLTASSALLGPSDRNWLAARNGVAFFWVALCIHALVARKRTGTWTLPRNAFVRPAWLGLLAYSLGSGRLSLGSIGLVAFLIAVALLLSDVILRKTQTNWSSVVSAVSRTERLATFGITMAILFTTYLLLASLAELSRVTSIPPGASDSLGHPEWTMFLDEALEETPNAALRYVTATAHHLQGNLDRARVLYISLLDDERARVAIEAIDDGRIEVSVPSGRELSAGLTAIPPWKIADLIVDEMPVTLLVHVSGAALLICFLLLIVPSRQAFDRAPGSAWRVFGAIAPGFWSLRTGATPRGVISIILATFVLVTSLMLSKTVSSEPDSYAAPGPFSAASSPSYDYAPFPLPGDQTRADIPRLYRNAIFLSHPGSRAFLAVIALAFVSLVVLHGITIRDILRSSRAMNIHEAPTALTPSPENTPTVPLDDSTEIKPSSD